MEAQLRFMTKEEAHKLIDSIPGDGAFIITYDSRVGKSDTGKYIKKKASNKLVDKAKVLVLSTSQITTLNLHDIFFSDSEEYIDSKKVGIVKTILVPQLE